MRVSRSPPIPPELVYLSVLLAIGGGARGACKLSNVFLSLPPATYIQERDRVRAPCCLCPSPCTSGAVERASLCRGACARTALPQRALHAVMLDSLAVVGRRSVRVLAVADIVANLLARACLPVWARGPRGVAAQHALATRGSDVLRAAGDWTIAAATGVAATGVVSLSTGADWLSHHGVHRLLHPPRLVIHLLLHPPRRLVAATATRTAVGFPAVGRVALSAALRPWVAQ